MCGGKPRPSSAFDEKPSPQSFTDRRPGPHGQLTHLRFSVCLFVSQQRFQDFIILNRTMHLSIRGRREKKLNDGHIPVKILSKKKKHNYKEPHITTSITPLCNSFSQRSNFKCVGEKIK
jgi:hypothetical protein